MNRALRKIVHPEATAAERAALERKCKADVAEIAPVWIAANGAAVRIPPRNHAEEIANARAEDEARRAG